MSYRRKHVGLFRAGALAALAFLSVTAFAGPPAHPAFVRLARGAHPFARPEYDVGPLDPAKRLENLAIHLKPSAAQQADREAYAQAVSDPRSPLYRHFLTPAEYADRFGAKREDVARTVAWLKSQGFDTIDDSSPLRLRVTFAGTVAQVKSAFHAEMRNYKVGDELHYAMSSPPEIPADLADVVLSVHNTHDFYARPMISSVHPVVRAEAMSGGKIRPDYACTGTFLDPCPKGVITFSPPDWAKVYNVPSGYDGTGVNIMVVGVAPFAIGDVAAYRTQFLPNAGAPNITTTVVPNTGPAGETQPGAAVEAILDLEWASSLAPKSAIQYIATGANDPNVFDAIFYGIEQNLGGVLSVSFGGCEQGATQADADVMGQYGSAANILGITFLAASGDSSAATCMRGPNPPASAAGLYVSFPASAPNVTAVGGTQFPTSGGPFDANGNATGYSSTEAVWNESNDPTAATGITGGGGGISVVFSRPSYQTQASAPTCTPVGSLPVPGVTPSAMRQVPDVAFSAAGGEKVVGIFPASDGFAGILIECTLVTTGGGDCGSTAGTEVMLAIGGTSASTPAFAAVVALANQAAGGRLGNINPLLYSLPSSVFHDVTNGNNEAKCTASEPGCGPGGLYGYAAGPGYDCGSGLGSVDATNLVQAVKGATGTTTTLGAIASPVSECNPVPLSATVTGTGSPGGVVTFAFQSYLADGTADLSYTIGTASVSGGSASTMAWIPPGMVNAGKGVDVVAEYGGDPTHLPSVSSKVHVTFGTPSLCVPQASMSVAPGSMTTLTSSGGVSPVHWFIYNLGADDTTPNPDGGAGGTTIDENTGVLKAGTGEPGFVLVQVIDAAGAETFIPVTVGSPSGSPPWSATAFAPNVCSGTVSPPGCSSMGLDAGTTGGTDGGTPGSDGGLVGGDGGTRGDAGAHADGGTTGDNNDNGNLTGSNGCGCTTAGRGVTPFGWLGAGVMWAALLVRRRRARQRG